MSKTDVAHISPAIITWAIKRSGLKYPQIKKSLKTTEEQIKAWEQGKAELPFDKAFRLAEVLHVPFGYLFLNSPPELKIPLPDFRKLTTADAQEPSIDLLETLYSVMAQQDWYKEYALEHDAKKLSFVGSFSAKTEVDVVAKDIRHTLKMNNGIRKDSSTWSDYLTKLTRSAEAAGVMVMRSGVVGNNTKRPLSVKEFQGFAITDNIAPVVFINSRDYETAKIFTLVHELAHIWIGQSGISLVDEIQTTESTSNVETFCNAVAAETLVPKEEFLAIWSGQTNLDYTLRLAKHFFVSSLVILRRARELNLISVSQFINLREAALERMTPKTQKGGGSFFVNVEARNSTKLFEAVINDVNQGRTMYRQAAKLLNLNVPTLVKYVEGRQKS